MVTFTIGGRLVDDRPIPRTAVCPKCGLWVTDSYWHTASFRCYAAARRYRSMLDPARRQPGKFTASWTGCVGRRLRQGVSTATGSVTCSPGTSRPGDRVGCRNRRLTRQANQRDNVIIRRRSDCNKSCWDHRSLAGRAMAHLNAGPKKCCRARGGHLPIERRAARSARSA